MNDPSQRLRDAMAAQAAAVEPAHGWPAIQAKAAARRRARQRRLWAGAAVAAAFVVAVAVGVTVLDDDPPDSLRTQGHTTAATTHTTEAPTSSSTSEATTPSSTTESKTTVPTTTTVATTTAAPTPPVPDPPAWVFPADPPPVPNDPRQLALAFAQQVLGFADPQAGAFQRGDGRSGEVAVRPRPTAGATTTVLLRAVDAEATTWVVIGAASDAIRLDSPQPLAFLQAETLVSGAASAFEGHLDVELRDRHGVVLASTFATAAAGPDLEPFQVSLPVPEELTGSSLEEVSWSKVVLLVVYEGDASGEGAANAATVIPIAT